MPEDTQQAAQLAHFQQREKFLTEKIAKLKSGDLNASEFDGDGRQDEAIMRNEKLLRDVRKGIAAIQDTPAKTKIK